MHLWNNLCFFW